MKKGLLFIISGPSGSGKGTVMKKLLATLLTGATLLTCASGIAAEAPVIELNPIKKYGIELDRENEIITGIPLLYAFSVCFNIRQSVFDVLVCRSIGFIIVKQYTPRITAKQ